MSEFQFKYNKTQYFFLQINSIIKTTDKTVSAELTVLANVTDNQARYRCEAQNSATEIPMFETKTLSVHCKCNTCIYNLIYNVFFWQE